MTDSVGPDRADPTPSDPARADTARADTARVDTPPADTARVDTVRVDPEDWPEAIADVEGPQLVVAGPGTGKSEFLARRAAYLVEHRVAPHEIAVLTFSRRAASDLRRRIVDALGRSFTELHVSTFHSFAFRLLEAHAPDALGEGGIPAILTGPEQVALVQRLLAEEDPTRWPVLYRPLLRSTTLAEEVADFLLRAQERLLDPTDVARLATNRDDWRALPGFMERYLAELEQRARLDYGTLQARAVGVLEDEARAEAIARRFPYVLVDEFQDTTPAQARLAVLLARHGNLTVAADPYQSVYSFRGAELNNVDTFVRTYRDAKGRRPRRIVLTTSFRVPEPILRAAERLTQESDVPGAAGPVIPAPHPGAVEGFLFDQRSYEAEWIATQVERLHLTEAIPYRAMAVLVRTKRRLLPELSRALERRRIPHDTPDVRLVDHPAVRIVIDAVVAAAYDDADPIGEEAEAADRAIRRLVLGPLIGRTLGELRDLLRERHRGAEPWSSVLRARPEPDLRALGEVIAAGDRIRRGPVTDGFWWLWERLPNLDRLVTDPQAAELRAAWAAFAQALERQAERDPELGLVDYVRLAESEDFEATPLLSHRPPGEDRLTLTTLHQAKGLEFDVVFIADAVEGVFPDLRRDASLLRTYLLSPHRSTDPAQERTFRLQEETRLAYTAMTRARRRVVWTATEAGMDEGEHHPSRFITAALGVPSLDEVPRPTGDGADESPVTAHEFQAMLRRTLADPEAPLADRLAAAAVLADPGRDDLWDAAAFAGVRPRGPDAPIQASARLSPSQADAYATCPRRYVLERKLGLGRPAGPHAAFGSLLHEVLETVERAAMQDGRTHATLDEALAELETRWQPGMFGPGAYDVAWRRRAEAFLQNLYERWPHPDAVPVALEKALEHEIGGVPWYGRADRIERDPDGSLRVVDYKTGKSPSTGEIERSLQLAFYITAAEATFGEPVEGAEFWHPLSGRKSGFAYPFDMSYLAEAVDELAAITDGIVAEDWTPVPSNACGRCDVRLVCPEFPEGAEGYVP